MDKIMTRYSGVPPNFHWLSSGGNQWRTAMSKITVELSDSLQRSIAALAKQEGYSIDQFIASAAAEKMAALRTLDYLRQEAANGRGEDFDKFLAAVPDRAPAETDRISD
jgi:hypothetical protein